MGRDEGNEKTYQELRAEYVGSQKPTSEECVFGLDYKKEYEQLNKDYHQLNKDYHLLKEENKRLTKAIVNLALRFK